nr:MAG TPA: hypothetical protein [Caudoviricetes sp.]
MFSIFSRFVPRFLSTIFCPSFFLLLCNLFLCY